MHQSPMISDPLRVAGGHHAVRLVAAVTTRRPSKSPRPSKAFSPSATARPNAPPTTPSPERVVLDGPSLARGARTLCRRDARLAALIRKVGPCTLEPGRQPDHLTALVRTIVFQQLSGKAAATIFGRLQALLPEGCGSAEPSSWLALTDEQMRAAGVSRPKISYVRDLCERAQRGSLPLHLIDRLGDDELTQALTEVKGLGRWSAHMILMFHLGRPDVWPIDDLGIRKALMRMDGLRELPGPKEIMERADAWRPWRSVASWYLWRSLDVDMTGVGW